MALREYLGELGDLAGQALRSGGVQVAVKTNLGPEFRVGEGAGLTRALGVKAAVIVRDRQGHLLFTHGDPPPTNYALLAVLAAAAALAGFFLVRGVVKR